MMDWMIMSSLHLQQKSLHLSILPECRGLDEWPARCDNAIIFVLTTRESS